MSAQEIQSRLNCEISGINQNSHGWSFRQFLLSEPEFIELKDHHGVSYPVWVVLKEPGNGYWVIFDPEENEFGLASGGVVIGTYEGFMATINAI